MKEKLDKKEKDERQKEVNIQQKEREDKLAIQLVDMETYFKTLETRMATVMTQTAKVLVSAELARFQAAVQGARIGPIQLQIYQAGYTFNRYKVVR